MTLRHIKIPKRYFPEMQEYVFTSDEVVKALCKQLQISYYIGRLHFDSRGIVLETMTKEQYDLYEEK